MLMVEMLTNYERVMKRFIPAFRMEAAKTMVNKYGVKQQQAALMLGTTQAAISKYLKADSGRFVGVKIENKPLRAYIEKMQEDDSKGAQKVMCAMCQSNKKFDCAFMVK
jgi:predicted transcriptional regulator